MKRFHPLWSSAWSAGSFRFVNNGLGLGSALPCRRALSVEAEGLLAFEPSGVGMGKGARLGPYESSGVKIVAAG